MYRTVFTTIVLFLFTALNAQNIIQDSILADSSAKVNQEAVIKQTIQMMADAERLRVQDSLRLAHLEKQLERLHNSDSKEHFKLQYELDSIRSVDSLRKVNLLASVSILRNNVNGVPVTLGQDTICYIYTSLGQFSPLDRAEASMTKIKDIAKKYGHPIDSLRIIDTGSNSMIAYGDQVLLNITDTDAAWLNQSRDQLAHTDRANLYDAIKLYQKETSFTNRLKQVALCLLVIVVQILLVKGVNYLFSHVIDSHIKAQRDKRLSGLKIKNFEVLNSDREVNTLLFMSKLFRYFLNLVQFYISIPILFSIFPATSHWSAILFGWVLTPVKKIVTSFVEYLPNLLTIIIIVIVVNYIIKLLRYFTNEIAAKRLVIPGFYSDWAHATFNILRFLIYAFMFVVIFPYLPNSQSEVFKGVSVFIGLVFSLGSSSVISNIISGLVITYMRPFMMGDRIRIGDIQGDVVEKTPFVTRIKTVKNEIVTVPNSSILTSNIINFTSNSQTEGLIVYTTVTIGYDAPWKQVHQLLIEAALRSEYIEKDPQPFVLQTSLDDFYVSYQLSAYTKTPSKMAYIYSQIHQNIQDTFNEAGVEIMSPHYRGQRDGNETTIPANYRPEDYEAPEFRVKASFDEQNEMDITNAIHPN